MHPFSEYLQEYVYNKNKLQEGKSVSQYNIEWSKRFNVTRDDKTLNPYMLQKAFAAGVPQSKKITDVVELPSSDYIVFTVTKVTEIYNGFHLREKIFVASLS